MTGTISGGVLVLNNQPSQEELQFQEKMKERMRQAFGDLMPDAVLAGIVARGIEEAFFKPQMRQGSRWEGEKLHPPWLVEFLETELRKQVQESVVNWFKENQSKVQETLQKVLQDGMGSALVGAFNSIFQTQFYTLRDSLSQTLNQLTHR